MTFKRYVCILEDGGRQTELNQYMQPKVAPRILQSENHPRQNGLGWRLLPLFFLEIKNLSLLVKGWAAFIFTKGITGMSNANSTQLFSQERQKSTKTASFT